MSNVHSLSMLKHGWNGWNGWNNTIYVSTYLQTQKFAISLQQYYNLELCHVQEKKLPLMHDTIKRALRPFVLVSVTNYIDVQSWWHPHFRWLVTNRGAKACERQCKQWYRHSCSTFEAYASKEAINWSISISISVNNRLFFCSQTVWRTIVNYILKGK